METVQVTDLKQWMYCPRIVYYHRVLGLCATATFKMQEGRAAHDVLEKLERRRSLKRYGLEGASRRFAVSLHDPELGLAGRLDLLLHAPDNAAVVDFKLTGGGIHENHELQLAAYGLLVQRSLRVPVRLGFVYRIPDASLKPVRLDAAHYDRVIRAVRDIRGLAAAQTIPDPPQRLTRCTECEYINFCADRW